MNASVATKKSPTIALVDINTALLGDCTHVHGLEEGRKLAQKKCSVTL